MLNVTPETTTAGSPTFPHGDTAEAAIVDHMRHSGMLPEEAREAIDEETEQADDNQADVDHTFAVFDIETGPLSDEQLEKLCPEFSPPPHPGTFDPESVKCGNLGAAKAAEKIQCDKEAHQAAVERYAADVEAAKAAHFAAFKEKAALSATTGRVVAIGIEVNGETIIIGADRQGNDRHEDDILHTWWSFYRRCVAEQRPLVGFNTHGFDLPFLVRRSWILGVPVPTSVRQGRYWNPLFIDLMKVWALDGRDMVSLDTIARAFGLAGKINQVDGQEVSGAMFHELWKTNRPAAVQYLARDLELPTLLAVKMGVA